MFLVRTGDVYAWREYIPRVVSQKHFISQDTPSWPDCLPTVWIVQEDWEVNGRQGHGSNTQRERWSPSEWSSLESPEIPKPWHTDIRIDTQDSISFFVKSVAISFTHWYHIPGKPHLIAMVAEASPAMEQEGPSCWILMRNGWMHNSRHWSLRL